MNLLKYFYVILKILVSKIYFINDGIILDSDQKDTEMNQYEYDF